MRLFIIVLLGASTLYAQTKTCTSVRDSSGNTTIDCSDLTSATVTPLSHSGNTSTYAVTNTTQPVVTPPAPQPIPLPALSVRPVTVQPNSDLLVMAAMAASNRPPTSRQLKKFCSKHPGQSWNKRNFNGVIVAEGTCPAN